MPQSKPILKNSDRIAFVMSPRLGDALLSMIIVYNLHRQGYKVDVYSNYLYALRDWFPYVSIQKYPESPKATLTDYDVLLHTYRHDILGDADQWHDRVVVFDDDPLHKRCISMVKLQVLLCEEILGLKEVTTENGLIAPEGLVHRRHAQRVVIHPEASLPSKCWLPQRFVKLAQQLKTQGYQPEFVVAPNERERNQWIVENDFSMPEHTSLDALARWLYQSGWFVGNDSGIGHLASNLGIPTVSLMQRPKTMRRWRPDWAPGEVVLPSLPLILKQLKEKYWKYCIPTRKVMAAFAVLRDGV